jgi:hypothetical protein
MDREAISRFLPPVTEADPIQRRHPDASGRAGHIAADIPQPVQAEMKVADSGSETHSDLGVCVLGVLLAGESVATFGRNK